MYGIRAPRAPYRLPPYSRKPFQIRLMQSIQVFIINLIDI